MNDVLKNSEVEIWGEDDDDNNIKLNNMVPITVDVFDKGDELQQESLLSELSLEGLAQYINSGNCKNILVLTGSGVSASSQIADFYNPSQKILDSLKKCFKLPSKEALLDFNFFVENPEPLFDLMKEIFPDKIVKPTVCHYFIRLLSEKGFLLRNYTQNVDSLEYRAKIPPVRIVEARGTFRIFHCTDAKCRREYSLDWILERIGYDDIPSCIQCDSLVRPDIIFTEESIPEKVFKNLSQDFSMCDLLIVIGTNLNVQPLASMYQRVSKNAPRLVINKEKIRQSNQTTHHIVDSIHSTEDEGDGVRDIIWLGNCDDGCMELADHLGWLEDLEDLIRQENEKIDLEIAAKEELKKSQSKGCCCLL